LLATGKLARPTPAIGTKANHVERPPDPDFGFRLAKLAHYSSADRPPDHDLVLSGTQRPACARMRLYKSPAVDVPLSNLHFFRADLVDKKASVVRKQHLSGCRADFHQPGRPDG
ncbi:hypothetical protein IVB44_00005, partial [Bradyrhizobium sp. 49]|nr:hypothetical protein [Bradyrhizobium sp. 84]MCK1369463.1 hypothetical protein [Bradyrhizobium sp. 49]